MFCRTETTECLKIWGDEQVSNVFRYNRFSLQFCWNLSKQLMAHLYDIVLKIGWRESLTKEICENDLLEATWYLNIWLGRYDWFCLSSTGPSWKPCIRYQTIWQRRRNVWKSGWANSDKRPFPSNPWIVECAAWKNPKSHVVQKSLKTQPLHDAPNQIKRKDYNSGELEKPYRRATALLQSRGYFRFRRPCLVPIRISDYHKLSLMR